MLEMCKLKQIPRPPSGSLKTFRWRYAVLMGGFVGALGLLLYPIAISPMIDPSKYKKIQSQTRAGINQAEIQPGNMKVWSDPFGRKKEKED